MSSQMLDDDLPEDAAIDFTQKSQRNVKPSQSKLAIDGDGGDESDLAMIRVQRDEARAKLAAALLKIEQLQSEPCARCHFYSDWTVRVRTMSGQEHSILCPDGPKTLVAHVKQKLALLDPKCHILQQVALVLFCKASSGSSSSADPTDPALADDHTLDSYALANRDVLDYFLVDVKWSNECREMIEFVKNGGNELVFKMAVDDDLALAVSWALVNAINPAVTSLAFGPQLISAGGALKTSAGLCALSNVEYPQIGPRISKLSFGSNDIGNAGANSCAELMRVSTWLKELNLIECGISSDGVAAISSALCACASNQSHFLNFSYNRIGLDGVKSIGAALSIGNSLQVLCIRKIGIDTDAVQALAEALKINCRLRGLDIGENAVNSDGVVFLADALYLNSSLQLLILGSHDIGDDGAMLLSAALRVNSGLCHLVLPGNGIGNRGTTSIGSALRANTVLQRLDLSHNKIGDAGVGVLGIALTVNSSLTCIKLDNNVIGDGGVVVFAEALCINTALTSVTLHANKLGALGVESIAKAQRENSRLEPIGLEQVEWPKQLGG